MTVRQISESYTSGNLGEEANNGDIVHHVENEE